MTHSVCVWGRARDLELLTVLAKSSQPRTIKYFLSSPPSGDLEWKVKGSACYTCQSCDLSPPERVSLTLFFTLPLYLSPQNAHTSSSVFLIHFILGGASSYINGCTTVFHIVCMRERHSLFTRGQSSAAVVAPLCHSSASQETLPSRSQISSRLHPGCCSSLPVLDANQKLHQVEN